MPKGYVKPKMFQVRCGGAHRDSQLLEGRSQRIGVQGHLQLYIEFKASLGSVRSCQREGRREKNKEEEQKFNNKEIEKAQKITYPCFGFQASWLCYLLRSCLVVERSYVHIPQC